MNKLTVCITEPLTVPLPGAQLVVFSDLGNYLSTPDLKKMLGAAVRYAKKHQIYLVPGRFVVQEKLCLCLIGPDGQVLGGQSAVHLNLNYRGQFTRSEELSLIETPFGKIALMVDVDINYPQMVCRAAELGAGLIISSQYIQLYDFHNGRVDQAAVNAAQSGGVHVVAVTNAGSAVVGPMGNYLAAFAEALPISAALELSLPSGKEYQRERCRELLCHHSQLMGGFADV